MTNQHMVHKSDGDHANKMYYLAVDKKSSSMTNKKLRHITKGINTNI